MDTRWIHELFSFSRKERSGIIALLVVIFLLIVTGWVIPLFVRTDYPDRSEWEAEVKAYLDTKGPVIAENSAVSLSVFDPNKVDSVSLITMGLPVKVVSNWIRYLRKGGSFSGKEGVKRIYGMTDALYDRLDSFMIIPAGRVVSSKVSTPGGITSYKKAEIDTSYEHKFIKKEKPVLTTLEVNSADSTHLLAIPGIGPVLSSRIVRYRNLLGGYYALAQLKEVYGMREESFSATAPYFTIEPSAVKTFNINFSTVKELGRHPYIGYRSARKIFKLRDKVGRFSSPADLSSVLTPDSLKRLVPYLRFSE